MIVQRLLALRDHFGRWRSPRLRRGMDERSVAKLLKFGETPPDLGYGLFNVGKQGRIDCPPFIRENSFSRSLIPCRIMRSVRSCSRMLRSARSLGAVDAMRSASRDNSSAAKPAGTRSRVMRSKTAPASAVANNAAAAPSTANAEMPKKARRRRPLTPISHGRLVVSAKDIAPLWQACHIDTGM